MIDGNGVLRHYTKSEGVNGIIKESPEDFIVEEISNRKVLSVNYSFASKIRDFIFPLKKKKRFVHATLVKKNYTTLKAIKRLEQHFKTTVGYAGLKDKSALTSQRISVPSSNFFPFHEKDILVKDFTSSFQPIRIGDLWGNKFTITIRNSQNSSNDFISELEKLNYELPNFFGEQRFGGNTTHIVGENLLRGDWEGAAKSLLTLKSEKEHKSWSVARDEMKRVWPDVEKVNLPKGMWIERKFIQNMSNGFETAFRRMDRKIVSLYIHAFQSLIFNKLLSEKILSGKKPLELDIIGYKTRIEDEDLKNLLYKMDISVRNFEKIGRIFNAGGEKRPAFMKVNDFKVLKRNPLTVSFSLRKGSYATIVLNEIMKS